MNQFGDLTVDEYRYFFLGLRSDFSNGTKGSAFLPPSGVTLPDTVDWRTKGYVTPVKNQGMLLSNSISTMSTLNKNTFSVIFNFPHSICSPLLIWSNVSKLTFTT